MNDVVTSTLAIEADGRVREYDGGYDDYLRQRATEQPPDPKSPASAANPQASPATQQRKKLSFKERLELESLPARIEQLESEIQGLHETMASPAFYKQDGGSIAQTKGRLAELERELTIAFERWELLEGAAS